MVRRYPPTLSSAGNPAAGLPNGPGAPAYLTRAPISPDSATRRELPLSEIRSAPFPKLIVSGAHHAAFDAVCDELTQRLDAERAVIAGAGHEVQMTRDPFNETLLSFWRCA